MFKDFIDAGADVTAVAKDGTNSLIALATNHYNHPDFSSILRLLIKNGAEVNAVSFKKQNVLPVLCKNYKGNDFVDIVKLLIDFGIETNNRDSHGLKALDILMRKRQFNEDSTIVRLIRETYKMKSYP